MDIAAWLKELGLERYAEAFLDNDVDSAVLLTLSADDLKELGVSSLGHRRKLLEAIAQLRASEPTVGTDGPEARRPRPAAERRQLTVLFCDLVGSTELSARLDPEDMGELIRGYQRRCAEAVERWGGHVAKYMGDGVLAYFGWPQAHEDEAERAVRAGLALTGAVAELATPAGDPLAARVGIATGLVMVGELIGEGAAQGADGGRRDPEPRGAAAGARGAGQRRDQPGDAPAGRRAVRAGRSRPAAPQRLRRAARRLAGRRRGSCRRPLRGAARRAAHAAGRARARARHPARALGLGQGRRRPGGAAVGRARHRQVARGPGAARAPRRRAVHAAQPLLLAAPYQQRALPGDRPAGTSGAARSRRAAGGAARQARGGARPLERPARRGRAPARRPARAADRRALPGARPHAGGAKAADACRRWSTSSRAWRRSSRCWRSTRTCTGSTRRRSSSWAS